jgi:DNA-binding response OmpR family regulator
MKGDEQKAIAAGCDGYITKPIDTRTLGKRIRQLLTLQAESGTPATSPPAGPEAIPAAEMHALRRGFLQEGQERARQLLLDLDEAFDAADAARAVHQWVGTGGLLGYTAVSRLAREVEALLLERPVDSAQVRESLTSLLLAFSTPREALDAPIPEAISQAVHEKYVAIVGLPAHETQRLCVALERARARANFFEASSPPDRAALEKCDLLFIYVSPGGENSAWLDPSLLAGLPIILVGGRDSLLELDPAVQSMAADFLMDSWQPEEALVRLSQALTNLGPRKSRPAPRMDERGRIRVLVAEDDSTVRALVSTALANFGMECHLVGDGLKALEAARQWRPQAAILDVQMPDMDGYEVLAAIRAENLPVRVMLLTAHQLESDIVRGFTLGADDYVVKPFSPMELVARIKRLVPR